MSDAVTVDDPEVGHYLDLPPPAEDEFDQPELTDEELLLASYGIPWCPEPEPFDDFIGLTRKRGKAPPAIITPSEFTEFAFRMPKSNGLGYEPFTFEGRRHMRDPYDTSARRVLLKCARQVEKSTMLGNKALAYSCMVPAYRTLYVSPSATQTKTFSADRIREPIETSPILKNFTTRMLSQNVFEKQFINRSKITLRFAYLNADRTRGIPAYRIVIDELQDILLKNIAVIEQAASHAEERKTLEYAGTPKSLDNIIEHYWSGFDSMGRPMSTQGEWVVPCDRCGSAAGAGRFWNILNETNIGKKGLICQKCGELINPRTPKPSGRCRSPMGSSSRTGSRSSWSPGSRGTRSSSTTASTRGPASTTRCSAYHSTRASDPSRPPRSATAATASSR
jgi:phage terminase large subunit GpA-like protein